MSTKERGVLIHYYQNAIVATTLRYKDDVADPSHFAELKDLPEAGDEELAPVQKIVDKMIVDLNLSVYHDGYKERIETLIKSKTKGEVALVKEERPKKPVAKSMMEAEIDGRIVEVICSKQHQHRPSHKVVDSKTVLTTEL